MSEIYYGSGRNVYGPYHPEEMSARARIMITLRRAGRQVYEIRAKSYEDARHKLLRAVARA